MMIFFDVPPEPADIALPAVVFLVVIGIVVIAVAGVAWLVLRQRRK